MHFLFVYKLLKHIMCVVYINLIMRACGVTNHYSVFSYYHKNLKLDDLKLVINDYESLYGDLCNDGN